MVQPFRDERIKGTPNPDSSEDTPHGAASPRSGPNRPPHFPRVGELFFNRPAPFAQEAQPPAAGNACQEARTVTIEGVG
jgi:hypothetical protein